MKSAPADFIWLRSKACMRGLRSRGIVPFTEYSLHDFGEPVASFMLR